MTVIPAIGVFAFSALGCLLLAEKLLSLFKPRHAQRWIYVLYSGLDHEEDRVGGWTLIGYTGDEPPSIETMKAKIARKYRVTETKVLEIIPMR